MSGDFARLLAARCGWSADRIALFDSAFSRYWERAAALAGRTHTWPAPRLRNVGVVLDPVAVRPFVQLLNTSSWLLYDSDFDPALSDPEFAAYLFAHGDRMALTGEVTMAAVRNASYWFERSEAELAAFAAGAARSTRPDAAAFQALANAIGWLRQLHHETLRPASVLAGLRPIPETGLLVPERLQAEPPKLVAIWERVARQVVRDHHAAWLAADPAAGAALCEWLAGEVPPLIILTRGGRVVWDPETPSRLGSLRDLLRRAPGAAVRDVHADLIVVAEHTRRFLSSLAQPELLPAVPPHTEQRGYVFLHPERRLLAYDLDEPDLERLSSPSLPYARAMLGARALHEWAHLGAEAGWVPCRAGEEELDRRLAALAEALDETVARCPPALRERTAEDLAAIVAREREQLGGGETGQGASSPGRALARLVLARLPDYQANLLAARYWSEIERETYVRQNVRTLRFEYAPAQLWRMLVRYLYEAQYLRFSAVADPRTFFLRSTWFDAAFLATKVLDAGLYDRLVAAVGNVCDAFAVEEKWFQHI